MSAHQRIIFARIGFAALTSLLLHALFFWQWSIDPLSEPSGSSPIQARLEKLPKPLPPSDKTSPPERRDHGNDQAHIVSPVHKNDESAKMITGIKSVPAVTEDLSARRFSDERAYFPQLPRQANLIFDLSYGSFKVGETLQEIKIDGEKYELRAETFTSGLAGILKPYRISQVSQGHLGNSGFFPDQYSETRTDDKGTQRYTARFNWTGNFIQLEDGRTLPINDQTQDTLSLPYQFAQLPLTLETMPIASTNGRTVTRYFIAIGEETLLDTPLGKLHTIPVSKVHKAGETGIQAWLALEYQLLPVKITLLDPSGNITATMLIRNIRIPED